mmetsp:Transcript_71737/g.115818  ORF Transcript_71737/g.115818 Transcript_71737/m.115818 type:complete len:584 (+) Transcript_71737:117-1868(+)
MSTADAVALSAVVLGVGAVLDAAFQAKPTARKVVGGTPTKQVFTAFQRHGAEVAMVVFASLLWLSSADSRFVLPGLLAAVGGATIIGWLALDPAAAAMEISKVEVAPVPEVYGKESPQDAQTLTKELPKMTIEEVQKHDTREDAWIVIEDAIYEVTAFAKDHPGGPLPIWGVAGRDATDHFLAFHPVGTEKWLRRMKVGTLVGYKPSEAVADYRQLRRQIIELGLFEIDRGFFVRKFLMFLSLLVGAAVCSCRSGDPAAHQWSLTLAGAVMLGVFFQQMAGLGHDVGHNSIVHNRPCDRMLGLIFGNLLSGISMGWWKKSHNTHHVVPNSLEFDPDIQHLPVFAVSDKYFNQIYSMYHDWTLTFGNVEKFLVSHQHILYVPIMGLARFNLYVQSWLYVGGFNARGQAIPWQAAEVATLLGFMYWMWWLCSLLPSAAHIAVFLLVSHGIAGLLHIQITISHFSMELYAGRTFKNDEESWLHTQLATTMDVDCPSWLDWFHIGLQFQVEHHVFPRLPRHNLRQVQSLLMPLCKKHGIHHHNVPWSQSLWETYDCLKKVAMTARSTDTNMVKFRDTLLYAGLQAEG